MMTSTSIKVLNLPATHDVNEEVAVLLASAFAGDSTMIQLLGEEKWQRISRRYFLLQLDHASLVVTARAAEKLIGVLLAKEPMATLSGWRGAFHLFQVARLLGSDYAASQQLAHGVATGVPSSPHWYINQLAVLPGQQSGGIGSDLIKSLKQLAGQEQIYVDCESSLSGFYEAAGFNKVSEFEDIDMIVLGINE